MFCVLIFVGLVDVGFCGCFENAWIVKGQGCGGFSVSVIVQQVRGGV